MSDTALNLSDQRGPEPGRRVRDRLSGQGGEWFRWVTSIALSIAAGILAAWLTVSVRLAVIEERQTNQNSEVLRRLDEQSHSINALREYLMRAR